MRAHSVSPCLWARVCVCETAHRERGWLYRRSFSTSVRPISCRSAGGRGSVPVRPHTGWFVFACSVRSRAISLPTRPRVYTVDNRDHKPVHCLVITIRDTCGSHERMPTAKLYAHHGGGSLRPPLPTPLSQSICPLVARSDPIQGAGITGCWIPPGDSPAV